jgi:hypothetical protein
MKFSTETIEEITQVMVKEFEQQLEKGEEIEFTELEQSMREVLMEVGRNSLGKMLSTQDELEQEVEAKCQCGGIAKRISRRQATVLSVFGNIEYRRSIYYCEACGGWFIPLDEKNGLQPGQASQVMAKLLAMAGVTVSFEEAQKQIREYILLTVSVNTIRKATQTLGEKQKQREDAWIEQSQNMDFLQNRERLCERPERVYGSIDGAYVPVEQEWREEKTICWYQAEKRYGSEEQHATRIQYYTSLEKAKPFGELAWASGVHYHADLAKELIFVCDGAKWIWKIVSQYFPKAVQIVDWYHACEYLQPIADALFPSDESKRVNWVQEMKDLLWEGETETVIRRCKALKNHRVASSPANKAFSFYVNNQTRMDYPSYRRKGYFIGSGTVESACKQIVSMRLKRSGARWSSSGAQATAKARALWLSDDDSWNSVSALPLVI